METDEQFLDRLVRTWMMHGDLDDWSRLFALARRGAAMQWRPIETAPKDGTPILLRDDAEDEELEAIYFAMAGIWTHGKWHFPGHGGWQPSPWFVPLRWMPLPPPPAGDER